MGIQAPKKITLNQFGPWLQKATGAEFKNDGTRVDCVVSIDHVNPGKFAALYAIPSSAGLLILELSEYYGSQAQAWQALENNEPGNPPVAFCEWVKLQYLTDKNARVEMLEI